MSGKNDDDDFELPSIKKTGGGNLPLILLASGGVVLVLFACLVGAVIVVAVATPGDPMETKLLGSWKGRFVLDGRPLDFVFTFNKDGSLRQDCFDLQGRLLDVSGGRWSVRNGEVEIVWQGGGRERATAHWPDNNTIHYRIVDHTEVAQIGLTTTFRRQ